MEFSSAIILLAIGVFAVVWMSVRNHPKVLAFDKKVMISLGFRPDECSVSEYYHYDNNINDAELLGLPPDASQKEIEVEWKKQMCGFKDKS